MRINEYITVETAETGAPVRFHWRGVPYAVVSAPEPWIGRKPWWSEARRVPRGTQAIDVPMWRVDALPLGHRARALDGCYDLCFEPELGAWSLVNAWNDELDDRLFA